MAERGERSAGDDSDIMFARTSLESPPPTTTSGEEPKARKKRHHSFPAGEEEEPEGTDLPLPSPSHGPVVAPSLAAAPSAKGPVPPVQGDLPAVAVSPPSPLAAGAPADVATSVAKPITTSALDPANTYGFRVVSSSTLHDDEDVPENDASTQYQRMLRIQLFRSEVLSRERRASQDSATNQAAAAAALASSPIRRRRSKSVLDHLRSDSPYRSISFDGSGSLKDAAGVIKRKGAPRGVRFALPQKGGELNVSEPNPGMFITSPRTDDEHPIPSHAAARKVLRSPSSPAVAAMLDPPARFPPLDEGRPETPDMPAIRDPASAEAGTSEDDEPGAGSSAEELEHMRAMYDIKAAMWAAERQDYKEKLEQLQKENEHLGMEIAENKVSRQLEEERARTQQLGVEMARAAQRQRAAIEELELRLESEERRSRQLDRELQRTKAERDAALSAPSLGDGANGARLRAEVARLESELRVKDTELRTAASQATVRDRRLRQLEEALSAATGVDMGSFVPLGSPSLAPSSPGPSHAETRELEALRGTIARLEADAAAARSERESRAEELKITQARLAGEERKCAHLQDSVLALRAEMSGAIGRADSVTLELRAKSSELTELRADLDAQRAIARETADQLGRQRAQQMAVQDAHGAVVARLSSALSAAEAERDLIQTRCDAEREDALAAASRAARQTAEQQANAAAGLRVELGVMRTECESLRATHAREVDEARGRERALAQRISALEEEAVALKAAAAGAGAERDASDRRATAADANAAREKAQAEVNARRMRDVLDEALRDAATARSEAATAAAAAAATRVEKDTAGTAIAARLASIESECVAARAALAQARDDVRSLQQQLEESQSRAAAAESAHSTTETGLRRELARLEGQCEAARAAQTRAEGMLAAERTQSDARADAAAKAATASAQEIRELEETLTREQQAERVLAQELENQRARAAQLFSELAALRAASGDTSTELQVAHETVEQLRTQLSAAESAVAAERNALRDAAAEKSRLSSANTEAVAELSVKSERVTKLEGELARAETERTAAEAALRDERQERERKETTSEVELRTLRASLASWESRDAERVKRDSARDEAARTEMDAQQATVRKHMEAEARLREELAKVEASLAEQATTEREARVALAASEARLSSSEARMAQLTTQLQEAAMAAERRDVAARDAHASLRSEAAMLAERVAAGELREVSLAEQLRRAAETDAEAIKVEAGLRVELSSARDALARLREEGERSRGMARDERIAVVESERTIAVAKLDTLTAEMVRTQNSLVRLESAVVAARADAAQAVLRAQAADAELRHNTEVTAAASARATTAEEEAARLQRSVSSITAEVARVQELLAASEARLAARENEGDAAAAEAAQRLALERRDHDAAMTELRALGERAQAESARVSESLRTQLREIEDSRSQLQASLQTEKASTAERIAAGEEAQRSARAESEQLRQEVTQLKAAMTAGQAVEARATALAEKEATAAQALARAEQEVVQLKETCARAEQEATKLREELGAATQKSGERVTQAEEELAKAKTSIAGLEERLVQAEQELAAAQQRATSAEHRASSVGDAGGKDEMEARIAALVEELDVSRMASSLLQQRLDREAAEAVVARSAAEARSKEDVEEAGRQLAASRAETAALAEQLEMVNTQSNVLKAEVRRLAAGQPQEGDLQARIQTLETTVAERNTRVSELTVWLAEAAAAKASAEAGLGVRLQEALTAAADADARLEQEQESHTVAVTALQVERDTLRLHVRDALAHQAELEHEVAVLRTQISSTLANAQAARVAEAGAADASADDSAKSRAEVERLKNYVGRLEADMEQVNTEAGRRELEAERTREAARAEQTRLAAEVARLEGELEAMRKQPSQGAASSSQENEAVRQEVLRVATELLSEEHIADALAATYALRDELARLQEVEANYEDLLQKHEQLGAEANEHLSALTQKIAELKGAEVVPDNNVSNLRAQLADAVRQRDAAEATAVEVRADLLAITGEHGSQMLPLADADAEIARLRALEREAWRRATAAEKKEERAVVDLQRVTEDMERARAGEAEARAKLAELQAEITRLFGVQDSYRVLQAEHERMVRAAQRSSEQGGSREDLARLRTSENEVSRLQRELTVTQHARDEALAEQRRRLSQVVQQRENDAAENELLRQQCEAMRQQYEAQLALCAALEAEVANLKKRPPSRSHTPTRVGSPVSGSSAHGSPMINVPTQQQGTPPSSPGLGVASTDGSSVVALQTAVRDAKAALAAFHVRLARVRKGHAK